MQAVVASRDSFEDFMVHNPALASAKSRERLRVSLASLSAFKSPQVSRAARTESLRSRATPDPRRLSELSDSPLSTPSSATLTPRSPFMEDPGPTEFDVDPAVLRPTPTRIESVVQTINKTESAVAGVLNVDLGRVTPEERGTLRRNEHFLDDAVESNVMSLPASSQEAVGLWFADKGPETEIKLTRMEKLRGVSLEQKRAKYQTYVNELRQAARLVDGFRKSNGDTDPIEPEDRAAIAVALHSVQKMGIKVSVEGPEGGKYLKLTPKMGLEFHGKQKAVEKLVSNLKSFAVPVKTQKEWIDSSKIRMNSRTIAKQAIFKSLLFGIKLFGLVALLAL